MNFNNLFEEAKAKTLSTGIKISDEWENVESMGPSSELLERFPDERPDQEYLNAFRLPDRVSPFPRPLNPKMSEKILSGIKQRFRIMKGIHRDVFHQNGVFKEVEAFRRMIETSTNYNRESLLRNGENLIGLFGEDLIVCNQTGRAYINEDNVGSDVGGPSDIFHLRKAGVNCLPSFYNETKMYSVLEFPKRLEQYAFAMMKALGISGEIVVTRSNLTLDEIKSNNDEFFYKEVSAFDSFVEGTSMLHRFTSELYVENGVVLEGRTGKRVGMVINNGNQAWIDAISGLREMIESKKIAYNAPYSCEYFGDKLMIPWISAFEDRFLEGEKKILAEIPTFPVADSLNGQMQKDVFDQWLTNPENWVLKGRTSMGGKEVWVGAKIDEKERLEAFELMKANPANFLMQKYIPMTTYRGRGIDMRVITFLGHDDASSYTLPGGMGRSSAAKNGKTNMSLAGREHDVVFLQ